MLHFILALDLLKAFIKWKYYLLWSDRSGVIHSQFILQNLGHLSFPKPAKQATGKQN